MNCGLFLSRPRFCNQELERRGEGDAMLDACAPSPQVAATMGSPSGAAGGTHVRGVTDGRYTDGTEAGYGWPKGDDDDDHHDFHT